jgi:hypothetical protein
MRAATLVGILLVLIGIAGFAVGGISFTHEKKDVNLGPVQVSHEKKETVPISPIEHSVVGGRHRSTYCRSPGEIRSTRLV